MSAASPSTMPYTVTQEEVGIVRRETISVVHMPQERFLGIVHDILRNPMYAPVQAAVRDSAARMVTFPLSAWITRRGCGCLVGELLIAMRPEDDCDYTARLWWSGRNSGTVWHEIRAMEHGRTLLELGMEADRVLSEHVVAAGVDFAGVEPLRRPVEALNLHNLSVYIDAIVIDRPAC